MLYPAFLCRDTAAEEYTINASGNRCTWHDVDDIDDISQRTMFMMFKRWVQLRTDIHVAACSHDATFIAVSFRTARRTRCLFLFSEAAWDEHLDFRHKGRQIMSFTAIDRFESQSLHMALQCFSEGHPFRQFFICSHGAVGFSKLLASVGSSETPKPATKVDRDRPELSPSDRRLFPAPRQSHHLSGLKGSRWSDPA